MGRKGEKAEALPACRRRASACSSSTIPAASALLLGRWLAPGPVPGRWFVSPSINKRFALVSTASTVAESFDASSTRQQAFT